MTDIPEVTATSWGHLQELLFTDHWPRHRGPFHSHLIHRGLTDREHHLVPSLQRHELTEMERHLLRNFKKYSRVPDGRAFGDWEWLTIGQHHGLPTRLLDWTYSPYVALHFAVGTGKPEQDGVVWSLDYVRVHTRLPAALARSAGALAPTFTTETLDRMGIDPTHMPRGRGKNKHYMLVLEPPSLDDRVVNQYAGLSAMSSPSVDIEDWLTTFDEPVAHKIIIPKEFKPETREKLDKANINERVIFPGLDGLAQWLTRYYGTGKRAADWESPTDTPSR